MNILNPQSITHVIWDWNGTLVDDAAFCASIVSSVLQEQGLPRINEADYRRQFRFPVREFYNELGFSGSDKSYLRVCDSFISKYRAGWRKCSLQEGSQEVLKVLNERGLEQVMLSASHQHDLEASLYFYGIEQFFSAIMGQNNTQAEGKVQCGRNWFADQEILPEQVLLVGDTNHDFEVATALGARCLLYAQGHQNEDRLGELPPKKIWHLKEVLDHLL
ncbi:MAG: HAD family hydrolase [Opitutae bacterium]|nr:HAD family hydrolase [Opitutae bacterium]